MICAVIIARWDGLATIAVRRSPDRLSVVTAEARKEDIVAAAQGGAAGYIVKPFTKATLEEKLTHILKKNGLIPA